MDVASDVVEEVRRRGYAEPFRVIEREDCPGILRCLQQEQCLTYPDWLKGCAAVARSFYDVATLPALLNRVEAVLGPHVILWSAALIVRKPDARHDWHSDIESASVEGGTLSAWIGLQGVSQESAMKLIAGSHTLGKTVQQVAAEQQATGRLTDDEVLAAARELQPDCALVQPAMTEGEALLFDGKLWHGTHNERSDTRIALLLQYAAADQPMRIPQDEDYRYPFAFRDDLLPPCLLVTGEAPVGVNRLVPPPERMDWKVQPSIPSQVLEIPTPSFKGIKGAGASAHLLAGATASAELFTCHSTCQRPGGIPHPPHTHEEEEILLVLSGQADLLLQPDPEGPVETQRMEPGRFIYYPSDFRHSLINNYDKDVQYLMFKWRSGQRRPGRRLGCSTVVFDDLARGGPEREGGGWASECCLDAPTEHLRKLHCHVSRVAPGEGYEPHVDGYDVVLLILEGVVDTLEGRAPAGSLVFYGAGTAHGLRNSGTEVARYLVWEFHGESSGLPRYHRLTRAWKVLRKYGLLQFVRKGANKLRRGLRRIRRALR